MRPAHEAEPRPSFEVSQSNSCCLIRHQPDYTCITQAPPGGSWSAPVKAGSARYEMPALAVVGDVQADRAEGEQDEHAFLLDGMRQSSK